MNRHLVYALAHPVFDPARQITPGHAWRVGRIGALVTVNIGME